MKRTHRTIYRRKREKKTDYRKRLKLLLSERPRLVIRKSNKNTRVQLIGYAKDGDKVLAMAHTGDLEKLGWVFAKGSVPAAYLTGYLAGKKALAKGVKSAVTDIGMYAKSPRLFSALKGALDSGLDIPHDEKVLPKDEMLNGEHIKAYAATLKEGSQFSKTKEKIADYDKIFKQVKEKISQ